MVLSAVIVSGFRIKIWVTLKFKTYTNSFLRDDTFRNVQIFKHQAEEYIVKHADGVFLWVSLILNDLMRYTEAGQCKEDLMAFLRGYQRCDINAGVRILQFCLFSHRAIELLELKYALTIPGELLGPEFNESSLESRQPTDIVRRVTGGNFVEIKTRPTFGVGTE
ncbi:hypothetical protein BDD12DRAFT_803704 [Trichophaea hybrida]|nr:hypothetical protein BDD12DRAFT_803704 [Trichophaea hybrida]